MNIELIIYTNDDVTNAIGYDAVEYIAKQAFLEAENDGEVIEITVTHNETGKEVLLVAYVFEIVKVLVATKETFDALVEEFGIEFED